MNIELRSAREEDFAFARNVYFETMRWIIERLFGWDQAREEKNFTQFFKLDEVRIITVDGQDVGWIQEPKDDDAIFLGSFYIVPEMQRRGIGSQVLQTKALSQTKPLTIAVVKINPALSFYEGYGFKITHEDQYKFYMKAMT